ncbi:hypothetical protein J6O48_01750 [bacterium]|nr:hypothetical protein [bacterium]
MPTYIAPEFVLFTLNTKRTLSSVFSIMLSSIPSAQLPLPKLIGKPSPFKFGVLGYSPAPYNILFFFLAIS